MQCNSLYVVVLFLRKMIWAVIQKAPGGIRTLYTICGKIIDFFRQERELL